MKSFKGKDWVMAALDKTKRMFSKAQYESLTEKIKEQRPLHRTESLLRTYKLRLLQGVGALGLLASISVGGNEYVQLHTYEVYHVYVGSQIAGTVSDPKIVEDYIIGKVKQLEENNPNVHMVLNSDEVAYKAEKAYKIQSDDEAALMNLDGLLKSHAVGVQLVVNDKLVGIVKDKEMAEDVLNRIKGKYVPQNQKKDGRVSVLSVAPEPQVGETVVQSAEFMEKVDLKITEIKPEDIAKPEDLIVKLETGDVAPSKYTVEKGDCVGCIAKKLGISKQLIYEKNPWIQDDKIKIGDVLDVTMLKPALTVKTVEKIVENQEVQHEIIYEKDDTMRAGQIQTIKPGKNGMKKVTFLVTKANGYMMDQELVDEEIIEQPVPEYAKKGTKVILGEGSGKFIWPVVGAKLSDYFGMRWGKMHKGVDITGNRNIVVADNGVVTYTGDKGDGYGNKVVVDHKNGYVTVYGHLSKIETTKGKIVEKGEKIGVMGSTGDSTGVHLHFEIQRNGVAENPLKFLSR
ncbi:M23 family metallopeptidase [Paenibacillus hemerocallicola]|jgi:murein DD-endopeptidase MepM/ murein hydrolase activator NlpD|uniref:M23 family metallopeptidase n=1 Tax=Paenibacillus hemerocallicola TaxID=1172614 RepID=A0A5C4SZI1_9BACL|nr:M23 family metallopeptidase [Paenibacillus hemerocallicola]TNJ62056.1 M23 family metallopeptidase [Paenibacillus hemerocallicola]